ncbi:MAG: hypothetical protein IH586_05035 [Anaerolineaceae bacterium]|nr:hypothetical protein [Anaerolineaceae bacterium]
MKKQEKPTWGGGTAWRICGLLLIIGVLLGLNLQPVLAQTYRFSIPESTADVYANSDGTVTIDYYYLFQNSPSADPIDIVDVGMPTTTYDMGSITATINGQAVQKIAESQYVKPGVEIHLGGNAIQPGKSGELRVHIEKVERMLFKAKTEEAEAYASFQYTPNYYGSEFVSGKTNMTVTLHLPPGLKENEPRYFTPQKWPGNAEPETAYDDQERVYYRWNSANATSSDEYVFGSSFPARLVPAAVLLTEVPFQFNSDTLCPILFCLGFAGFVIFTIWAAITGEKKRRLQYLPPKVSVEGNGIKRGLTAVEAALLMQQPMDKILTMILFAVVKKGAATVVSRDPMKLEIAAPLPEDLRTYESDFTKAMALEKPAARRTGLQNMMTDLVKSVSEKMRGFSRKETMAYYQDIMNKAWQQVEQAQTPEMKMQMFDDAMDWTMLDKRFDDHTRDVFGPRPVIVPIWWGRYDPTFSRPSTPLSSSIPSISTAGNRPPQGVSMPNLPGSDFAASMVTGMQSFSSNVIGDITSFTSGVTNKTNPVPKTTTSSGGTRGGGGGGRSCACACACAGCACACAGGGR